ncbi:TMEM43 family protein [Aminobacter sp. HY435]|uniref:TMEM43 family protein n=1 Tax=Aminobacter sp. HY435 TaxID=2970917 RepID=UPI0022B9CB29|nr:TMEM43 family protein [Aminobacter sp. HY435]
MSDQFQEVTSVSWFGRIKRSVGGVLVGLIVVVAMVVVLFWNEGRAVTTARSLAEGASAVVSVPADTVDPANEGRLIHVSGAVTASVGLVDEDFGVSAHGVRLVREVEMYQWVEDSKSETTTKMGGGEETVTTYSYSKEWRDRPINSAEFKQPSGHENPSMEIDGRSFQIPEGKLSAFTLDQSVLDMIGNSEKFAITSAQAADVEAAYQGTGRLSVTNGGIFLGANPSAAAVGDYRISYLLVPLGDISIVGKQAGSGFTGYQTVAGDELLMVDAGMVPAAEMFAEAVRGNTIITWVLRIVCLLLLAFGFSLLLGPFGVLADVIPSVGSIVRMGTGLVAFALALLVGSVTIAFAWFWYRPVLALGILAAGLALSFLLTRMGKRKAAAAAPSAGAAA